MKLFLDTADIEEIRTVERWGVLDGVTTNPTILERGGRTASEIPSLYGVQNSPRSTADFMAMMEKLAPRFEPHPIVNEFLAIIQSGVAAPTVPKFLHRALARASVSLLPPLVRQKLQLGREFDLTLADKLALKLAGRLAERKFVPDSPPAHASARLGLPADFLWRKPAEQQRLLREAGIERNAPLAA